MRVRMLKAARAYWNYAVTDFPAGEEYDGDLARHLAANTEPETVEVLEADPEPDPVDEPEDGLEDDEDEDDGEPPESESDELDIDAKADDVLAWVGDDSQRAAVALTAEQAKDKPRTVLVKQLTKLSES